LGPGFPLRRALEWADEAPVPDDRAPEQPNDSEIPRLDAEQAAALISGIRGNVERALRGKSEIVRRAVETLLAGGHLLLEDVPGVGKTTLSHALARSIDGSFSRIQSTSDPL
jgi:MoxR-like ATPase